MLCIAPVIAHSKRKFLLKLEMHATKKVETACVNRPLMAFLSLDFDIFN